MHRPHLPTLPPQVLRLEVGVAQHARHPGCQQLPPGRSHAGQTVTVLVSDTTLAVELGDGDTRIIRRTTTQPVRSIKGQRPRTAVSAR